MHYYTQIIISSYYYCTHDWYILYIYILYICIYVCIYIYIYIYIYGIHHWRIFWSSYRKLAWVGFEPTTTEFRSDALTDWVIRPWVKLALRANFVQLLQFHRLFSVTFQFGYCLRQSPRFFSSNFWIYIYICTYICICTGLSAYPQKHQPSLFFAKPLINHKIVIISQFKFLFVTEKNIFVYEHFLSLNISDFSLFFM